MNESRWEKMTPGDAVLIYNSGRIRYAGEIAAKVRNKELARYFWKENETGSTWALMYFIVNEGRTDVPIEKLNPLFGYQPYYRRQGFSMINEAAVSSFAQNYGDILGVLKRLERGIELIHFPTRKEGVRARIDERIERVPTKHDEMQWRLIRLGQLAKCDVWVPRSDPPNSNSPLFIVASEDRKRRVFEELRRPTFSGPCLRLNEVIGFLEYEKLREIG